MPHPPTGGGRGAREAAALPESITMAAGDGDGPQSRGGGPAAVAGSAVPEGRSKETHELHNKGEAFFVSFDIETAGEQVGFIQISAEVFRLNLVRNKDTQGKYKGQVNSVRDTLTIICCDPELFNKYVNPESDIEWCPKAMDKNHLSRQHPLIGGADGIATVWRKLIGWV